MGRSTAADRRRLAAWLQQRFAATEQPTPTALTTGYQHAFLAIAAMLAVVAAAARILLPAQRNADAAEPDR